MANKNNKNNESVNTSAVYSVTTYETKKGKTAALIFGFADETAAKAIAAKMPSSGCSSSWRYGDNGQKRYCLSVSPRYVEVAKTLCDALNAGDKKAIDKACKDSCAIYDKVVAEGMAAREAKKQEREAKKNANPNPNANSSDKGYSAAEVAAMLKRIADGGAIPEEVAKMMAA